MLDQLFELSRKATESSLQMQQAVFKHWVQDGISESSASAGISEDWGGSLRKRWVELAVESLNKQRESIDSSYQVGIRTMEQFFRMSDAKSTEDSVSAAVDVWRSWFEALKGQSEAHFREIQLWAERWSELARKTYAAA